jgi:hypothetical protein
VGLAALKQAPAFFVGFAPRLALDFDPVGLLARSAWRITALRHYPFEFHVIGGLQELDAIIEAFRGRDDEFLGLPISNPAPGKAMMQTRRHD